MADQQLVIQVQAQIGDALAQLKAVQDQVKGVGAVGAAAISPIQGLFSVLGKVAAAVGIAFSVKAIINFGKSAVDAFTKADSAARQFINTLTERGLSAANALAASNAIGGAAVASGFEPEAIQQAMSNMIVKMNSGRDATLGMQVAMDNARIKGITLATSIQSVSIAALGSLKSLRQFGITTNKDVNGNLKTANQLLKEMADRTKGGLSTYMASPLGMVDRMKVSLQEMKEAIGGVLTRAFAPAAQMVTGFAGAITAMASVSTIAVPPLVSLAVAGARIGKVFMDSTYVVREFFTAINPKNWGSFDLGTMGFKNEAADALEGQWIDADIAYENYIRDLKNGTPEDEVNKQMKELQRLLAGVQTGADGATAAGAKTAAAWEAAFAPLKLLSGSIPNLAKYVGNLSSSFVLRSELNITIHDDTAPKGTSAPLSPSVSGAVHAAVQTSLRQATRGVVSQPASHGTHIFDGFASKYAGLPTSGSGGW